MCSEKYLCTDVHGSVTNNGQMRETTQLSVKLVTMWVSVENIKFSSEKY